MRMWRPTLLLSTAALVLWAGSASADPPPAPEVSLKAPLDPAAFRLRPNLASLGPVPILPAPPRWGGYYSEKPPLRTTGTVVVSLGVATMFGAGISAILTAAFASSLSRECPNHQCVEGTTGGRTLQEARDAALATDWLIGIGMPVIASGTVMLIYSAVLERNYIGKGGTPRFFARHSPVVRVGPSGGSLSFAF